MPCFPHDFSSDGSSRWIGGKGLLGIVYLLMFLIAYMRSSKGASAEHLLPSG